MLQRFFLKCRAISGPFFFIFVFSINTFDSKWILPTTRLESLMSEATALPLIHNHCPLGIGTSDSSIWNTLAFLFKKFLPLSKGGVVGVAFLIVYFCKRPEKCWTSFRSFGTRLKFWKRRRRRRCLQKPCLQKIAHRESGVGYRDRERVCVCVCV